MISSGLVVDAADGLHDDNWCWPRTRLTLKSDIDASEVRVGIWFKPEPGVDRAIVTVLTDKGASNVGFVDLGHPKEISLPLNLLTGEVMSLEIQTPHRASKGPGEERDLSFCLLSVVAI